MHDYTVRLAVTFLCMVVVSLLCNGPALAQHSEEDLAKQLQNPVASLISVPLQNNYDAHLGRRGDGFRYTLNVQPVIPFTLNEKWNLITRTIVPVIQQDEIFPGSGNQLGLGDILASQFFSPKQPGPGGAIWGIGPAFFLPTATDELLGAEKFGLGPTAPQTVMASWYHQLTKRSALMGNFGWQNWKQFGDLDVTIRSETSRSLTADAGFQDTWHAALGGQYRLAKPLLFSVGFAFDSSPVSKFNRSPSSPYDRNFRYGMGLQYDWNETTAMGIAYEFLDAGSAEIKNRTSRAGTLQGHYAPNYIHFLAFNMVKKF